MTVCEHDDWGAEGWWRLPSGGTVLCAEVTAQADRICTARLEEGTA